MQKEGNGTLTVRLAGKGLFRVVFFPRKTNKQLIILSSLWFQKIKGVYEANYRARCNGGLPCIELILDNTASGILDKVKKTLTKVFQKPVSVNTVII